MLRPRPVVDTVSVVGPTDTRPFIGLVDHGSDSTLLPERIATLIGVDLTGLPVFTSVGLNNALSSVRFALVTLKMTDGVEFRAWPAWVGFVAGPMRRPVLGYGGCLRFFTATFPGDRDHFPLDINSLDPASERE